MSEKRIIPRLLEESPISVYPTLAVKLGNVNKAIILQQVHYLLQSAKLSKNEYVHVDDKWWVYNSYKEWRKYFPWLAEVTIKGLFGMLEHDGLVVSRQGVKDKLDRRKWYTIDYDAYLTRISSIGQNLSDEHEIETIPSDVQNLSDVNKESENSNSKKESVSQKTIKQQKQELIDAWFMAMGFDAFDIGADRYLTARMQTAARLLKWSTPVTCDEIKSYCEGRKADTPQYDFTWLEKDLSSHRLARAMPAKTLVIPHKLTMREELAKMGIKEIIR